MNSDDKEDHPDSTEDALYKADYDEDTIDYDLDPGRFLEEETLEPEPTDPWAADEPDAKTEDEAEPDLENEADFGPDMAFENNFESGIEPPSEEVLYDDEPEPEEEEEYVAPLPLGLIAVAVIALLLLLAGGYGVIQQRTAMQEEIRQLQAALSTASSNTEVAASRQAQRALQASNEELQAQVDNLALANNDLRDKVSALELLSTAMPEVPASTDPIAANPKPITPPVEPASPVSFWFVNFGSYTQQSVANSWADKLSPDKGHVIVVPGDKGSTHYFRVRVIDLPSREIAEKIAHQLEQTHNLPRLWIGKQ